MRTKLLVAIAAVALVANAHSLASAAPLAPAVECWIENRSSSVPVGVWAQYVVHVSGGTGTYLINFAFGDGSSQQGTYASTNVTFSHTFWSPGMYPQSADVSSAGSSTTCTTWTEVY